MQLLIRRLAPGRHGAHTRLVGLRDQHGLRCMQQVAQERLVVGA
jgi:hypothetical protein